MEGFYRKEGGANKSLAKEKWNSLEESESSGWWGLLIGWAGAFSIGWVGCWGLLLGKKKNLSFSCWGSKVEKPSCWRCKVLSFSVWGNWWGLVRCKLPLQAFPPPILVDVSFINFHNMLVLFKPKFTFRMVIIISDFSLVVEENQWDNCRIVARKIWTRSILSYHLGKENRNY